MKKRGLDSCRYLKHHPPAFGEPCLREDWRIRVIEAVRAYPQLRREREEEIRDSLGHWSRLRGRPVEEMVIQSLPYGKLSLYNAVYGAIVDCRSIPHGSTATKYMETRYWGAAELRESVAAAKLGLPLGRARKLERIFFGRVARRMGHRLRKDCHGTVR